MGLASLLRPWSGEAYRHIPATSVIDPLDFRFAGRSAENRWNERGQPTLYLAGDEGVLATEWARHISLDRPPNVLNATNDRAVFRIALSVERVLDLRDASSWTALSLADAPNCFLNKRVARATAQFIRSTTDAQGILVPSVGLLDQLERWCLVLFLDKLPEASVFASSITPVGSLRHPLIPPQP